MPSSPKHRCNAPGCSTLVRGGSRCPQHASSWQNHKSRPLPHYWPKIRKAKLEQDPTCAVCGERATDVDHIMPRSEGGNDEWYNLQSLCHAHHAAKTAQEAERGKRRGGRAWIREQWGTSAR